MDSIVRRAISERRWAIFAVIATSLFSLPPSLFGASSLSEQAATAWAHREDPGQTEEAIRLWKEAAREEPRNAGHWIALARAMGRAVRHANTAKERRKWADEAKSAAETAVQLEPQNSDVYALYGEALGQWANAHKSVRSLSAVKKAVAALEQAITLKPSNAYAHMLLAEFYRQSPRLLSIGDKSKALVEARLAVQHGPEYAINHLVLARALLDTNQRDEAIAELKTILTLPAPANAVPETRADQATAKSMLDMLASPNTSSTCDQTSTACTEKP